MRILDKHVIKEFTLAFIMCLAVFIFLFIIIDCFSNLEDLIKNKVEAIIILKYYLAMIPMIFIQTSPIASLIATIYTIGKLNYNNELIAMRSGGLNIYQIVMPILIFGIIISIFIFFLSEKIVPLSQSASDEIKTTYIDKERSSKYMILKNLAIYGFKNRQFFINIFYVKDKRIEGLTVLEHDSQQNVVSKIFADKVEWRNGKWITNQCLFYKFDRYNHVIDSQFSENYEFNFQETPEDFLRQSRIIGYLNSKELFEYINKLTGSGAETAIRNLWIDFYQKITSPFTILVMIFIGLPCSMAIRRKAVGFSSIGVSVLVALLYYVIQAISIALGKNNIFPAFASVTITPILFVLSSIYLIYITP